MLRVLLTGGDTGGHIYPLIAVARELREIAAIKNIQLSAIYVGSCGDFGKELEAEHIVVKKVAGGKFRNYASIFNVLDIFLVLYSFIQALAKIFFVMPDVILSTGGPGALPVVLAGRFYRIPVIVHEANAIPGRTNIISGKLASRISIAFAGTAKYFEGKNVALLGHPLRRDLLQNIPSKEFAKTQLGFNHTIPLLLVLGGSSGATRINDFIFSNLDFLVANFQILHQVGKTNIEESEGKVSFLLKDYTKEEKSRFRLVPYFESVDEIRTAYAAADLIIARAGVGTIFELAALRKPAILIPLPEGKDQRANAYEYADSGAAVVMEQENLLPNLFRSEVGKILVNKSLQEKMRDSAGQFAKLDAARLVAEELLKLSAPS